MSSASERRKSSGGDGGGDGANWMDTYGDLVTLLLTFFVLLFSFSTIDAQKWEALVGSFTGISPIGIDPISPEIVVTDPIPRPSGMMPTIQAQAEDDDDTNIDPDEAQAEADAMELEELREIYAIMSGFIADGGLDAEIELIEDEYLVRTILNEEVLFNTADATVLVSAYPILDAVIEMLKQVEALYSMVTVEGHADIRPISTAQYPSNWHISAYRAVNVLGYLRVNGDLDPKRLSAVGYGEEQPIAPNDTPEGMARNRRVEFVVEAGERGRRMPPPPETTTQFDN